MKIRTITQAEAGKAFVIATVIKLIDMHDYMPMEAILHIENMLHVEIPMHAVEVILKGIKEHQYE